MKFLRYKQKIPKKRKQNAQQFDYNKQRGMKKGGLVKSSASKRADGVAKKGKTKGRMV
jgi:hypothetical protein